MFGHFTTAQTHLSNQRLECRVGHGKEEKYPSLSVIKLNILVGD